MTGEESQKRLLEFYREHTRKQIMTATVRKQTINKFLQEADRLINRAEKTTRPIDRHHYLRCAASELRRAGCEAAARLADRQALEALAK